MICVSSNNYYLFKIYQEITYHEMRDVSIEDPEEKFTNDEDFIQKINAAQSSWTAKAYPQFEK